MNASTSLNEYGEYISSRKTYGEQRNTTFSIIIVTYRAYQELAECLEGVSQQSLRDFSLYIVDNGKGIPFDLSRWKDDYPITYIKLWQNYGLSTAKNIGFAHSNSEIVLFLDDDAIPDTDLVRSHLCAYEQHDIVALRGRIKPKTSNVYNLLPKHYDLGESVRLYVLLSGHCSIKSEVLKEVGGFNPQLFGGEDLELSYRIVQRYGDKIIYDPGVLIYHDYADGLIDCVEKRFRHARMRRLIPKEAIELVAKYRMAGNPKKSAHKVEGTYQKIEWHALVQLCKRASWLGAHWPSR